MTHPLALQYRDIFESYHKNSKKNHKSSFGNLYQYHCIHNEQEDLIELAMFDASKRIPQSIGYWCINLHLSLSYCFFVVEI